ncbi:MAG: beta-lactamase family protein [Saprospiraceae bacterium]|nr:beta-lactamase family protein [Saprospiraceae bacterium]
MEVFIRALGIFLISILCLPLQGQKRELRTKKSSDFDRIDSIVDHYLIENKLVGVSIGIVKDGKIYFAKGYGTRESGASKPIDSLTNFLTCSVTKLFTATAIMQLSEQGKIDITQKLIYYLPGFKMKDNRYIDITIEQMLTHTSGLHWDMKLKHSPHDSSALRKLVYSVGNKSLNFAPGTQFDATKTYSNAAYDILGYVVQIISGKQYEDYISENILLKANMTYSSLDYQKIPEDRRSFTHILKGKKVKVGGIWTENEEHSPSGNLNSCSRDLCYWMLSILGIHNNPNSLNGIVKGNTLENMWKGRHVAPQNKRVSIGLGCFIKDSEEFGKYYWHVGNNLGFSSTLMIFPELNFGITVLSNQKYAEQIVWNKIPFEIIGVLKDDWRKNER